MFNKKFVSFLNHYYTDLSIECLNDLIDNKDIILPELYRIIDDDKENISSISTATNLINFLNANNKNLLFLSLSFLEIDKNSEFYKNKDLLKTFNFNPKVDCTDLIHTLRKDFPRENTISIVIPCYGQSKTLMRCVNSVINQTKKPNNIFVLLMDKESINLKDTLEDIGIKCFISKRLFLASARNFLISKVKDDFFIPLDADDELCNTYIETVTKDLSFDISITSRIDIINGRESFPYSNLSKINLFNVHTFQTTSLINTIFFKDIGMYDVDFNSGAEDTEFYLRALLNGAKINNIKESLFKYYINNDKENSYKEVSNINFSYIKILFKYRDFYLKYLNKLGKKENDPAVKFIKSLNEYLG